MHWHALISRLGYCISQDANLPTVVEVGIYLFIGSLYFHFFLLFTLDGVPPEWLQPIGGGTAAPATDVGGADPADAVTAAPANPGAQIGGGATEAPAATNPIGGANPAVDPNTVPGGDAATAAPATDSATAAPADPNAAIGGTPATTPITDFNTPIGGGATAAPVDPFAAAAGGGGGAAAPTGALVGGPAEQVVVPEAAIEEDDPVGETPEVPDNRPPAPPEDWKALPVDTEIIFGLALDGPYLAPWTKSKSWVFTNVRLIKIFYRITVDLVDCLVCSLVSSAQHLLLKK